MKYFECILCSEPFLHPSETTMICQKPECQIKTEEIFIDDHYVINWVQNNGDQVFEFLIHTTNYCITQNGVLEPFPTQYLTSEQKKQYRRGEMKRHEITPKLIKDMSAIMNALNGLYTRLFYYKNDQEIVDQYGLDFYLLLRFIINTNRTCLKPFYIDIGLKIKDFTIFSVWHPPEKELKFQNKQTITLFHGCPQKNWHSVLRNGLKNLSYTLLMAHGAAAGNGVYFGKDLDIPARYSNVIAVCEANLCQEDYQQAYYVIRDDKRLILRYVIILHKTYRQSLEKINQLIIGNLCKSKNHIKMSSQMLKKSIMRLTKEYSNLEKVAQGLKLQIFPETERFTKWKVILNENIELYMDFEYDFNGAEKHYPFCPPSVRIIRPIFKQHADSRVVPGGVICCELFSSDKWSPGYSIETLLVQLQCLLSEEIPDDTQTDKTYNAADAQINFIQLANQYGWFI